MTLLSESRVGACPVMGRERKERGPGDLFRTCTRKTLLSREKPSFPLPEWRERNYSRVVTSTLSRRSSGRDWGFGRTISRPEVVEDLRLRPVSREGRVTLFHTRVRSSVSCVVLHSMCRAYERSRLASC